MSRTILALQIVSANDLRLGHVVYLTGAGRWTSRLQRARCVPKDSAEAREALALATSRPDEVIGPYLVDVHRDDDGLLRPTHYRELIRLVRPSRT